MKSLTAAELATIVGGTVIGDPSAIVGPDVVIDSRQVTEGALFVALPGDHVDGHDYLSRAFDAGAGAALVLTGRVSATAAGGQSDSAGTCIAVTDVTDALGLLGRSSVDAARAHGMQTVGITGSMGKTSTKDLLHRILADQAATVSPVNSFNNEIGVPLTATGIDDTTRFLISEMGARGVGHIARLCQIAPPAVGVVLNVAHAHVGEFGSQDLIAEAKGELIAALPADGIAVLNADDPRVLTMAARTQAPVLLFADGHRPDLSQLPAEIAVPERIAGMVYASEVTDDGWGRHRFTLTVELGTVESGKLESGTVESGKLESGKLESGKLESGRARYAAQVQLAVPGRHQVINAVAAAAAAAAIGVAPAHIAASLDGASLSSRWRMELTERSDGVVIVNDAYNANPEAVQAALDTVATMAKRHSRRVGVVLADMLELGAEASDDHRAIGAALVDSQVAWAVFLGEYADDFAGGAQEGGLNTWTTVADVTAAAQQVKQWLQPGDIVLIKGSRAMALERVADELMQANELTKEDQS